MTMGADPLACAAISVDAGDGLVGFFVRKERKEHGLQRCATDCEGTADQQGQQDPGQPDQQHHVFLGRGKARAEGNYSGGQDLHDMVQGHAVAAAGECNRRHGRQDCS